MRIHLKKGEKLFVNGAVIRADQRCSIEFLNNVAFLLETHVMQAEMAKSPFQQLYFVVQTLLMNPENESLTRQMYWHLSESLRAVVENRSLLTGLDSADELIKSQRYFDALKIIRGLFPIESRIMNAVSKEEDRIIERHVA